MTSALSDVTKSLVYVYSVSVGIFLIKNPFAVRTNFMIYIVITIKVIIFPNLTLIIFRVKKILIKKFSYFA